MRSRLLLAPGIALILFAAHAPLLNLPFHWDELGYFIPAALDLFRAHAWIPVHTLANIHPPGLAVYLSAVWSITGFSIPATRSAMLLLALFSALASWSLARHLAGDHRVATGALALLLASPLFFTQSMMAQLDLPATLFGTLALLAFLRRRYAWSALACTAAVLSKETSLIAPAVFFLWLCRDRRWRQAALFAVPAAALGLWVLYLRHATGSSTGNAEFGWYNLVYPLHPIRLVGALLRRISYLFIEEFRWIGTAAAALAWRRGLFRARPWQIAFSYAAAQALFVTVLGGAVLERYLLPALPVLYTAFAESFRTRRWLLPATLAGLVASLFWNPPFWPFPQENNLAMVDFVRVQQTAAAYLQTRAAGAPPVVTAWPFTDALRYPDLGYVTRPVPVTPVEDFALSSLPASPFPALALYSRDWDPPLNILRTPWVQPLYRTYYGYRPPVTPQQLNAMGLRRSARWSRGGQWIEIWERQR